MTTTPFQIVNNGHRHMCTYIAKDNEVTVKVYGSGTRTVIVDCDLFIDAAKRTAMDIIND